MTKIVSRITPVVAATLLAVLPLTGAVPAQAQEAAPTVVTVTSNDPGWTIESDPVGDAGVGFAAAPDVDLAAHPAPPGNLVLTTGAAQVGGGTARIVKSDGFTGTTLANLSLEYSTLVTDWPGGKKVAPYLILDVELARSDTGDPTPVPATLVYEPQYTGTPSEDLWQSWQATDDDANWWLLTPNPSTNPVCLAGDEDDVLRCRWSEITSSHGEASVTALSIGIGDPLRTGDADWANVTAYADALRVGTASDSLYDFEVSTGAGDGHDAFALGDGTNEIWRFDLANPLTSQAPIAVTGLGTVDAPETLVGIDFHPTTGVLYGITVDGNGLGRAYDLGPADGDAIAGTLVTPAAFALPGEAFGVSFDPTAGPTGTHSLHVVSDQDVHMVIDPDTGAASAEAPLAQTPDETEPRDPYVISLAHADEDGTQVVLGAEIGGGPAPQLVELPDPSGALVDRGELAGVLAGAAAGLDTAADGSVFAAFNRPGTSFSRLYRVDPGDASTMDASVTHVGRIGGAALDGLTLPPTGLVGFADPSPEVDTGAGIQPFTVSRTGGDYGDVTVDVVDVTADEGSATASDDYTLLTSQLQFPHGDPASQSVEINVTRPADALGDVTVVLRLVDPRGVGNFVGADTLTLTIVGQEVTTIELSTTSAEVDEGDGSVVVTIERTEDGSPDVSALLRVKQGGSATAGADYSGVDETGVPVVFDAATTSVDVPVVINDDTDFESAEQATFELAEPSSGAQIGDDSEFLLTIDDEPAPGIVGFTSAEYSVDEGDAVEVVVERVDGNEGDTTVVVSDAGTGSAVAGSDYVAFGPVERTFAGANNTDPRTESFLVTTLPSGDFGGDRTIELDLAKLAGSANVDAAAATATITIRDRTLGNAFLLTEDGKIVSFDPADPAHVGSPVTAVVDPLGSPTTLTLLGIDFNPADQQLYGVAVVEGATNVYVVDPVTGEATPVDTDGLGALGDDEWLLPYPALPALSGTAVGVDFDGADNALRVVTDAGEHFVFDATTWQWMPGVPLAYGAGDGATGGTPDPGLGSVPKIAALGHDVNVDPTDGATAGAPSIAYGIDAVNDNLVRIDTDLPDPVEPDIAVLATIGELGVDTGVLSGLDVTTNGDAYAVLTQPGGSSLHSINLTTGQASAGSAIAAGPYSDVTFAPAGVIRFTSGNPTEIDGEDETRTFEVERVGGTAGEVSVDFDVVAGADDVTLTPGTFVFPDGSAGIQQFSVTVVDDSVYEVDESFTLQLANVTGGAALAGLGATLDQPVALVDDPVGNLVFESEPFSVPEDTGAVGIRARRADGGEGQLTVDLSTVARGGDDAAAEDLDYTPLTDGDVATFTFLHGSTDEVQEQPVALVVDNDEELDERFDVTLSNASQADALPATLTTAVTIENDDSAGTLQFSAAEYSVSEDAGFATVTVERVDGSDGAVSVDLSTAAGSGDDAAAEDADYTGTAQTVEFAHGESQQEVTIPLVDDTELEGDETFEVELTNASGVESERELLVPDPTTVPVTIRDAEAGSLFVVVADTDGDGAQELVRFDTARPDLTEAIGDLSGLGAGEQVVALDRRPSDGEYYALATDGSTGALYRLDVIDGTVTRLGALVDALGGPYPVAARAGMGIDPVRDQARIVDADGQNLRVEFPASPTTTLTVIEDQPVFYGDSSDVPGIAGVAFTGATAGAATQYDVDTGNGCVARQGDVDDTASADGGTLSGCGTVPAGATAVGFDVDEYGRFLVSLSGSPSTLYQADPGGSAEAVGVVGDDLVVDALAAGPPSGTVGFTSASFDAQEGASTEATVERSGSTAAAAAYGYRVSDDSGIVDEGEVVFAAGADEAIVDVPVTDDDVYRDDLTFALELFDLVGVEAGVTEASFLAQDDDRPSVVVSPLVLSVDEGDSFDLTLTLSNPTAKDAAVSVTTVDGTAASGPDFEALDLPVTLPADETTAPSATISVSTAGDSLDEPDETFAVQVGQAVNADLDADPTSVGVTIVDDDDPPVLSAADRSVDEGDGSLTDVTFAVTLSGPSGKTVEVDWATAAGSATDGLDYVGDSGTLTFDPGVTAQTVAVPVIGDLLDEPDETFLLNLANLSNALPGDLSATATIVDDDEPPTVSVGDARVVEGNTGTVDLVFPIRLSAPSAKTIRVRGTTADGTAIAGEDYEPVSGVATFVPGQTSMNARVRVAGDTVDEPDETVRLVLAEATNARLGDRSGRGTIVDDDEPPEPPSTNSQSTPDGDGYWIATSGGDVFGFGDAERFGSLRGSVATASVAAPVVDLEATAGGEGYWLLDDQGGVHTFGDARFYGSLPARVIAGLIGQAEATDMARTPDGRGYWILDVDGGVHTFGTARFLGSIPGRIAAGQDIAPTRFVSIAASPDGRGYTILDEAGGVHTFGSARFLGSIPGRRAAGQTIGDTRFVSLAATPDGEGYWILDVDGGVHTFGTARFFGSIPGRRAAGQDIGIATADAIEPAPGGDGYWIFDQAGGVFTFGSARFAGSVPGLANG